MVDIKERIVIFQRAETPSPALPQVLGQFERFASYFDLRTGPIGRVVGSEQEPAGSHAFFIWADDDRRSMSATSSSRPPRRPS